MTISHHPPEYLLADFAAGKLEEAHQLVVGVHVAGCARCARFVRAIEQLAGAALEDVEPVPIAPDAFDRVMSRIDSAPEDEAAPPLTSDANHDLPPALRKYRIGKRRRIAPGLSMRPIELSGSGKARAFLLRSAPGSRMLEHTHTGTELTLVLEGSFSHEGGRFGPGDFDYGDDEIEHRPIVGDEGPCVCLVAMTGDLRMNGFLGRLIGPFVRL
ncbi:ChrR-like anti-ECFsigma factor [Bradyrhizobium sp. R2.2-H]|jgi:putative transcriptional regulator|uniref:ChrR family anti-sigma-E factor n=1 Tax=unclassified Bradyrhizobium TaxID=2631580 RepID=UPI00105378F5|nr:MULTISPECIES: ChrR family anti-sigma-E factor [unclassified Bradyrhizobium]TCU66517.1 ChrR-like anti-ECFsigma factor [Bradyrhizobium sp. Y-H1]TCU68666.1 ChrR-like anti-ECFsigma factor [Bradyrhizobium sp. R2.2-H]